MSTVPLATAAFPTLADVVGDTLAGALAGHAEPCVWCGGSPLQVVTADVWSGAVKLRCPHCGSELEGVVARGRREARR